MRETQQSLKKFFFSLIQEDINYLVYKRVCITYLLIFGKNSYL